MPLGGGVTVDAELAPGADNNILELGTVVVVADDGMLGVDNELESGSTNVPFL